jgi:hypothetical protein
MAYVYRSTQRDPDLVAVDAAGPMVWIARLVSLIGGLIMASLAIRFLLSLLGANRDNAFAHFIYTVSHPFVSPFFGLFNYNDQLGAARFEFETLIAIVFWAFISWMITHLLTLGMRADREI